MLSYIPLFGLFLPVRVAQVSDMPLTDQAAIVLVGSIVASLAGVMAGRVCDAVFARTGSRQSMPWAGLVTIGSSYAVFANSGGLAGLLIAVIFLQVGINIVLAGLNALFAVSVAAQDKPQLASIVNLGLPIANLGLLVIGGAGTDGMGLRLALLSVIALLCFIPILTWRGHARPMPVGVLERLSHWLYAARPEGSVWLAMFAARSLVQLSGALLLTFAQPYLAAVSPPKDNGGPNAILLYIAVCAAIVSVPATLFAAHLAVKRVNPIGILQVGALVLAGAMVLFTLSESFATIVLGYTLFMAALVTYLAIDTAVIAQWLAHSPVVATRLGVMNLANTLPGILIPAFLLSVGGPAAQGLVGAFTLTAVGGGFAVLLLAFANGRLNRVNAG